jgi:protein SCO1/2
MTRIWTRLTLFLTIGIAFSFASPCSITAQQYSADRPIGLAAQELPSYLKHAGVQQHLNQTLPLNAVYTDESGRTGPLNQWIGKRPLVIALVYYKCTMMCPQVLHGLAVGLRESNLVAGKDYDVLTFSIDPQDTPTDAGVEKRKFIAEAGMPGLESATHFLTAQSAGIQAISEATGFEYVQVPGPDGKMNQFAHSSVIMFVTPDGRLSKYISGIDYPSRDLRLAVLDASQKKISNPVDLFLIYCCNYNPAVGRYSVAVLRIVSIAGAVTVMVVAGMIWLLTRKPRGRAFA